MFNILVVEDDVQLNDLLYNVIKTHDYCVIQAYDGFDALAKMENTYVDLIIADLMMPKMDGFEFIELLRQTGSTTPIIIVTAKEDLDAKRKGFQLGTDDYMVKPLDMEEVLWRIQALLRRSRMVNEHKVKIGDTLFDSESLTVHYKDCSITLPHKEFFLLFKLVSCPNRIYTKLQLMDEIWGLDSETDEHSIEVYISRLREKFKNNPDFSIVTVRGVGYKVVSNG